MKLREFVREIVPAAAARLLRWLVLEAFWALAAVARLTLAATAQTRRKFFMEKVAGCGSSLT